MRLNGVWTATVTPFDSSGKLALSAYEKLLRRLVSEKVSGFVPCATTGEGPTLENDERAALITTSVAIARETGRKVIAGCNGNDTKKVITLTEEAAKLGCDAALVVTPYYNKPTQAGLLAHYRAVADRSPIPVVLYNVPGRTSVNLLPETVEALFAHKNIIGTKEATGNYTQWLQLMGRDSVIAKSVMTGDCDSLAPFLAFGAVGIISACSNVIAKPLVEICELMAKGDTIAAFNLQKKVFPFVQTMFSETSPAPVKYALKLLGICEEHVRLPLVSASAQCRTNVEAAVKSLELR